MAEPVDEDISGHLSSESSENEEPSDGGSERSESSSSDSDDSSDNSEAESDNEEVSEDEATVISEGKKATGKRASILEHKCPKCPHLSFSTSKALRQHIRKEPGHVPYTCTWPDCTHGSQIRANLVKHIRVVHFKLPSTQKKELAQNNTIDRRNPAKFIRRDETLLKPDYTRSGRKNKKAHHQLKGASIFSSRTASKGEAHTKSRLVPLKGSKVGKRKAPVDTVHSNPTKLLPCYFNQLGACNSFFKSNLSRQVHYRTHLSIRPYYCTYPGCKDFRAEQHSAVYVHIRVDHFGLPATTKEERSLGNRIKASVREAYKKTHKGYVGVDKVLLHPCYVTLPEINECQRLED